jgi:hypothetical protein
MTGSEQAAVGRGDQVLVVGAGVGTVSSVAQAGMEPGDLRIYWVRFADGSTLEFEWSLEVAAAHRAAAPATALDAGVLAVRDLEAARSELGAARFNIRLDCIVNEHDAPPDRVVRVRASSSVGGLDRGDVAAALDVARRHGAEMSVENHGLVLTGFTGASVIAELEITVRHYVPQKGQADVVTLSTGAHDGRAISADDTVGTAAYVAGCALSIAGAASLRAFTLAVGSRIIDPDVPLAQLEDRDFHLVTLATESVTS